MSFLVNLILCKQWIVNPRCGMGTIECESQSSALIHFVRGAICWSEVRRWNSVWVVNLSWSGWHWASNGPLIWNNRKWVTKSRQQIRHVLSNALLMQHAEYYRRWILITKPGKLIQGMNCWYKIQMGPIDCESQDLALICFVQPMDYWPDLWEGTTREWVTKSSTNSYASHARNRLLTQSVGGRN